jgi:hypothetical protein
VVSVIGWLTAIRDQAFNLIRKSTLVETRPEDFKAVLEAERVATNVYLRKLHNFALDVNWLLGPVLPKAQWPKVKYPPTRAITEDEHRRICDAHCGRLAANRAGRFSRRTTAHRQVATQPSGYFINRARN